MDKISKKARSRNMSMIKSKNTNPELLVRKSLYKNGLHYRLHRSNLPGNPDIIFNAAKIVIFINGCFWHGHKCIDGHIPKTNTSFWKSKLSNNIKRDHLNLLKIKKMNWSPIIIWECQINKNIGSVTKKILTEINR